MSVNYEVMVQKLGKWRSESVTDDKDDSISRAMETLSRGKVDAVRVIEETLDNAGESHEKIVFSKSRSGPEKKKKPAKDMDQKVEESAERRKADRGNGKGRKKGRRSFGDLLLIIVLGFTSVAASIGLVLCIASK